jgi:hypothetical protein
LIAILSFLAASAFVFAASWYRLFWLITVVGVVMTIGFWRHRKVETWGNAACFLGLFIAAYGMLALWATWTM